MKKGMILLLLMIPLTAMAAQMKIAHVDSKLIFDGYKKTKTVQKQYDEQVSKWEQDAAKMQRELTDMKERLDKQSLMLSPEKKKEMESKLLKKQSQYQQFVQKIYGKEGDLFQKNQEYSGPILKKINKKIQDVAKQEGYDMVLDRATGSVVFWGSDNDLTQKVLDQLNKE